MLSNYKDKHIISVSRSLTIDMLIFKVISFYKIRASWKMSSSLQI